MRPTSSLFLAALMATIPACAVVSPPPMIVHQDHVLRPTPGALSVAADMGAGGAVFVDPFAGGQGSIEAQVMPELAVGISGGGGGAIASDNRMTALGSGRVYGVVRPEGRDWVALRFGLGAGGANTGLAWATGDIGATVGRTFRNRIRPYGGLSLALSVPIRQGQFLATGSAAHWVHTTSYILPVLGVSVRLTDRLDLTCEGTGILGDDFRTDSIMGGAGVIGLRYTFGRLDRAASGR